MLTIQATLPHRYGQEVKLPGVGKVKFDTNGQAEVADTEALRAGAEDKNSGYVLLDANAPLTPRTKAEIKTELDKLGLAQLQAKLKTAEVPEVEWKHLRAKADLVAIILGLIPDDEPTGADDQAN